MALQIIFEGADNGNMNCPNPIKCIACGGSPPYSWEVTKGILSQSQGQVVSVSPPSNPGSSIAGTAYTLNWSRSDTLATCYRVTQSIGCDDVTDLCSTTGVCIAGDPCVTGLGCNGLPVCVGSSAGANACSSQPGGPLVSGEHGGDCCPSGGGSLRGDVNKLCDKRTAQMISDGCNPCGTAMNGAIITVTDSEGVSVSRTIQTEVQ